MNHISRTYTITCLRHMKRHLNTYSNILTAEYVYIYIYICGHVPKPSCGGVLLFRPAPGGLRRRHCSYSSPAMHTDLTTWNLSRSHLLYVFKWFSKLIPNEQAQVMHPDLSAWTLSRSCLLHIFPYLFHRIKAKESYFHCSI